MKKFLKKLWGMKRLMKVMVPLAAMVVVPVALVALMVWKAVVLPVLASWAFITVKVQCWLNRNKTTHTAQLLKNYIKVNKEGGNAFPSFIEMAFGFGLNSCAVTTLAVLLGVSFRDALKHFEKRVQMILLFGGATPVDEIDWAFNKAGLEVVETVLQKEEPGEYKAEIAEAVRSTDLGCLCYRMKTPLTKNLGHIAAVVDGKLWDNQGLLVSLEGQVENVVLLRVQRKWGAGE